MGLHRSLSEMKERLLFFVILFAVTEVFPQNKNFEFDFDYAQFAYDSASNYVEFYYSINQSSLELNTTDSANYLDGILRILLLFKINDGAWARALPLQCSDHIVQVIRNMMKLLGAHNEIQIGQAVQTDLFFLLPLESGLQFIQSFLSIGCRPNLITFHRQG